MMTGTFKSYDDLLAAYGLTEDDRLDEPFEFFLKTIADKDVVLTNYNPLNLTFDAAFFEENPNNPGQTILVFPDRLRTTYFNNIGIDKLVDGSIQCDNCDDSIYCTRCGLVVEKRIRYDYEPKFSYGDLFDGNCTTSTSDNVSGTEIILNVCKDGLIRCPKCRSYAKFKEVSDSYA